MISFFNFPVSHTMLHANQANILGCEDFCKASGREAMHSAGQYSASASLFTDARVRRVSCSAEIKPKNLYFPRHIINKIWWGNLVSIIYKSCSTKSLPFHIQGLFLSRISQEVYELHSNKMDLNEYKLPSSFYLRLFCKKNMCTIFVDKSLEINIPYATVMH